MTVLEAIQKSADFLARKGVDSPRLNAELLLAHLLKLPRMKLYLNFERTLVPGELEALRELVRRRGQREPLQHVTGLAHFCGLELLVNRHVLVPRPETELLAEAGWLFLASLAAPASSALDFGTGSGCLALALASKSPTTRVDAVDNSAEALAVARHNAAIHQLEGRVRYFCGDGFAALPTDACFDLIVSNPPYIPSAAIDTLEPEVRDHDPRGALDGGADGLDYYRTLAAGAGDALKPAGKLMIELGDGQAAATRAIFELQNWVVETIQPDYNRRDRIMIARR